MKSYHRSTLITFHRAASTVAIVTISTFLLSTLVSELFFGAGTVRTVKIAIAYGLIVLIPALMATGASGNALARGADHPLIAKKRQRMKWIALNGIFVLLPSALALAHWASQGRIDRAFYFVQCAELVAGPMNLILLIANARAGNSISKR